MKKINYFFGSNFVKHIGYYILPAIALLLWQPGFSQGVISIDGNATINIPRGTCMGTNNGISFTNVSSSDSSGAINNSGTVECKGAWTNNSTTAFGGLVDTATGTVVLDGGTQTITGTTATTFNNLTLGNAVTQTGTVTLTGVSATVTGVLTLQNFEFATGINLLTIATSGSITQGTGFVSSLPGGYLAENTNSTSTYFYPVGQPGGGLFRPIAISPATNTSNTFKVRFVDNSPTSDGYTATSTDGTVCSANTTWYHQIIQTGADQAILTMYYSSAIDGIFSSMVHWQGTPVWTSMAPVTLNTGSYYGLTNSIVTNSPWGNFTTPAFALAVPGIPTAPVATAATSVICSGFTANWNASTNTATYFLDVAYDALFASPVYTNINVGNVTTYAVTGLTNSTSYYYRVRAENACGTSTSSNVIGPVTTAAASSLGYTSNTVTYCAGQAITANSPVITGGGSATGYSAPSLPPGLSISPTTGVISGTPTAVAGAAQTSYTVTATTTCGGNATDNVLITISPAAPAGLTYSNNPITYCAGQAITTNTASTNLTTGGPATTYSATLPAGLSINTSTGAITGTPTTAAGITATNYSVTATNSCGSNTLSTLNITILPAAPSGLTYSANPATYCYNTAITTNTPSYSVSGGAPSSYSVTPTLPAGLSLNTSTGAITGTPTTSAGVAAATYTVTATNSCGHTTASLTISVGLANTAPTAVSANNPVVCSGSTVTLTQTGGALGADNTNNEWFVYDGGCGSGSAVASSGSSSITFTPTAGAHSYYVEGQGCSTTACQPVGTYVFASAATATVTPTQPGTCTSSGSIAFSNASGGASTWINSTLGTGNDPANVTINGNASWQTTGAAGPRMELTAATGSQNSSMVVSNPNNYSAAGFRTELDLDIIPGSSADGFSISYGPSSLITPTTLATNGEQGVTNTLIASFSTYAHGSGEFNAVNPGIYLAYQGTLYYSNIINSDATYYNAGWVHVVFSVTDAGVASLTITNTSGVTTTVFSGVQLPATYTGVSQSGWNWCFAARTGGSNEECDIRNLNITAFDQYQYADLATNWQSSPTFSPVAAGTYTHTADLALQTLASPGCTTYPATADIIMAAPVVNPQPITPANPSILFNGGTVQLSDATTGGTWSSATTADATITANGGLVTGVSPGSSLITYTTATGGCTATTTVNVTTSSFGGISPSRWYRADLGVTASGGNVSSWQDYSANNYSATATADYPQYSSTAYNINYNPTLNFNGSEWLTFSDAGLVTGSGGRSIFGVATSTTNSGSGAMFGYGNWCNGEQQFVAQVRSANLYVWDYSSDYNTGDNAFATVNSPVLWYVGGSGATDYAAANGVVATSGSVSTLNTSLNFGLIGAGNGCTGSSNWSGDIGEAIYFSTVPTAAQKQEVESYLSVKYGVTKDQTSTNANSNYINSAGTNIWTTSSNTGYLNNIAGIGKDASWALLQNQSSSINTGTQVAIGSGTIAATNAGNTSNTITDQSYLIWGDNAGSVSAWTSTGAPAGLDIIARTWKVQLTGTVGSVQIQIPASSLPSTTSPQAVLLMISNTSSFTSATPITLTNNSGIWSTSSNITFTNGQYFTFATQGPTTITTQPVTPAAICSGSGTAMLSVNATGAGLSFQWQKGGVNISGSEYSVSTNTTTYAGTSTLTINPATATDAGTYTVIVTGTYGTVTSNPVILSVGVSAQAGTPTPANNATGVAVNGTLSWVAVPGATSYNVWFGNGTNVLTEVSTGQTGTTYAYTTNYNSASMYWRIDAVNSCGTTTGTVWNFTTVAPTFVTGANTWYAPPGVTCITVQCWGGGGSGAGESYAALVGSDAGGGGGGGGFAQADISVIPANQYTVYVGAGGAGTDVQGPNGNPSWFQAGTSTTYSTGPVFAAAGSSGVGSGNGTGGAGGTANIAIGLNTVTYNGGTGGTGSNGHYGGGGGGGAGSGGNGNPASGSTYTAGTGGSGSGGTGGAGSTGGSGGGSSASNYGGGGGAAGVTTGVFVSNNGGSGAQGQVIITLNAVPTPPTVGIITQPTCTVRTGSVALSGLPATVTWTVNANPGPATATGTTTTTNISPLAPSASYTFTVSSGGCTSSASSAAVINAAPVIPVAPAVTTPVMYCQNTTASALTATGSNLLWYTTPSGGTGSSTAPVPSTAIAGTPAVSYWVSQTTTCESPRAEIDVDVNPAVTANPTGSSTICYDATISAGAGGGTPSYTYSWSGGNPTNSATPDITAPGTYRVTVTDSKGCTATGSYTVTTVNPLPTATISGSTTVSVGNTSPDITFTGANGTPPYKFTYSVTFNGGSPSTYTVTSSGNTAEVAVSTSVVGTYVYTLISVQDNSSTQCSQAQTGSAIVIVGDVWLGTSTSWTDPANWNTGVPPVGCNANVIFPGGLNFYPVLIANASVGSVTMLGNSNINLQTNTLSVCGNWSSSGSPTVTGSDNSNGTEGLVIFNGTGAQTISGTGTIYELAVNNTNGVSLIGGTASTNIGVTNALDLQTGNFNVSNGTFTFLSTTPSQAAILDNFSPGNAGTISGSVKAERNYGASTYSLTSQHMMGSPLNAPALSQFGATGNFGTPTPVTPESNCSENGLAPGTAYGNVFSLDQSNLQAPTCGMGQWSVMSGTMPSTNGQGYSIVLAGAGTLTLTGDPNVQTSYTLPGLQNSNWSNHTLQGHLLTSGWQLMSNPYLATLDVHYDGPDNGTLDNQVQVWHAEGAYVGTYQAGIPGNINNPATVAPFQAFMVHVTNPGNNNSYTINGSDRVRAASTIYTQNANELDIIAENLGTHLLDKTVVAFNSSATDSFDIQYDADKLSGSDSRHTLYSLCNGKWMAINTLHDVATTSTVPVGFEPGANGNYTFAFNNISSFDPTTYIYLEDVQQHVMYNARNGNYQFSADSTDNWSRFVLHFTPPAVINSINATCNALGSINITQPGTANWNYTLTDGSNTVIASGVLNQNNPLNISAPAGTYTLTLTDNNNYTVTKVIQLSGTQQIASAFSPSASNTTVQTAVNFTNTSQNANTYSWNFGDGATSNLVSPVHTYTAPGTYTVELTAANTTGCTATSSQTITVSNTATGINAVTENGITLWSNKNRVYVDFTNAGNDVNAVIKIYDVLGQELSEDRYTLNGLYQKEIDNIEAAYVIVAVKNNDKITTKKLFINNIGK